MKKELCLLAVFVFSSFHCSAETPVGWETADRRAREIVSRMSFADKVKYTGGGKVKASGGEVWCGSLDMEQYGIPGMAMADASAGVRLRDARVKEYEPGGEYPEEIKTTGFPSPIALAATWNPQLAGSMSAAIALEAKSKGVHIQLAPGINVQRQPRCGRNFEYMGEDPYLISSMVAAYCRGMQDAGVIATVKHFAANNSEWFRKSGNSVIDDRALHEIYLPGFEGAINEGGCLGVMTAYNLINGEWAGQSKWLLSDLLRDELGYKGLIMTDWSSVWNAEKIIRSGQNIVMPNNKMMLSALKAGEITEAEYGSDIDRMVVEFMRPCIAMGFFDQPLCPVSVPWKRHEALARRVAGESIVLLKNDGGLLPLPGNGTVLVTGPNAAEPPTTAGGSASVTGYNQTGVVKGLKSALGNEAVHYADSPSEEELQRASAVVVCVGYNFDLEGENVERTFELPPGQDELIERCAAANRNVIVLLTAGGGVEMPWLDRVPVVLHTLYLGQTVGYAVADVLTGSVNPSGKLPFTMQKNMTDFDAYTDSGLDALTFPQGEKKVRGKAVNALQKTFLSGKPKIDGREYFDHTYSEGILVGYRWFDTKKIPVHFPFGHGLSYSTFTYDDLKVSADSLRVTFRVSNTGTVAGAETAQVYVRDVEAGVMRPGKELKGFRKVFLKPGESSEITFHLTERDLSFWDVKARQWTAEPGQFEILVGSSSADLRASVMMDYNR